MYWLWWSAPIGKNIRAPAPSVTVTTTATTTAMVFDLLHDETFIPESSALNSATSGATNVCCDQRSDASMTDPVVIDVSGIVSIAKADPETLCCIPIDTSKAAKPSLLAETCCKVKQRLIVKAASTRQIIIGCTGQTRDMCRIRSRWNMQLDCYND